MSEKRLEWITMMVIPPSLIATIGFFAMTLGTFGQAETVEDFWEPAMYLGFTMISVVVCFGTAAWVDRQFNKMGKEDGDARR